MMRILFIFCCAAILASCNSSGNADMYEASDLSATMRDMVEFSKATKSALENEKEIPSIPKEFFELQSLESTRGEHKESAFIGMTTDYYNALRGMQRGDSVSYFYSKSIDACITCHSTYCGGPMTIISKLGLN